MRLFYKKNKNFKNKWETFSIIFPTKEEDNFEEKLLDRLKDYIEHSHAPKHSSSHTVREISSYLSYQELLVEIQNLEDTLYQWKVLTIDERTYLLKKLTTLTVNNTLLTDL